MPNPITIHPLLGTVPPGPRPLLAQTPDSIAREREFNRRASLEALDALCNDPDGARALAAVLRGEC
jgi:hypothetical protein